MAYSPINSHPQDEYHSRPLATVVREILEVRKLSGVGPATVDELYNTLLEGGFQFTGKNDGVKKRGLSISLGKNKAFYRLPNGKIGAREWYNVKEQKATNGNVAKDEPSDTVAVVETEDEPEKEMVDMSEILSKPR